MPIRADQLKEKEDYQKLILDTASFFIGGEYEEFRNRH